MDNATRFYRGNIKIKHDNDLEMNTLYWEKEDMEMETGNDSDHDPDSEMTGKEENYDTDDTGDTGDTGDTKKEKIKKLVIRTYGLTKEGYSVCLEITGFKPYFLLKLPDNFSPNKIRQLKNKISYFMPHWRKNEISFSIVRMKKLYYFDNYKEHDFLKISFETGVQSGMQ